ncbi:hypothetical protein [Kineococcus terrestris]|uniref:hypothetical protein n=1 Tax=Kineococcus terrestris TaxID=2044856 RepID=UPI0034DAED6A
MTPAPATETVAPLALGPAVQLLRELGDLKRLRDARSPLSLADRAFLRSWRRLLAGEEPGDVARAETAAALAATRLAGVDASVLRLAGLSPEEVVNVLRRGFDAVTSTAGRTLGELSDLREALGANASAGPGGERALPAPPPFAEALVRQPRAGATHPTLPRVVVEPPESHGDHCFTTAVYAALLAPLHGVDRGEAFFTMLGHHLPNADLPDAGFGGEVLLGDLAPRVLGALQERSLAQLPAHLADRLRGLLPLREDVGSALGRACTSADVLDRVLQVHHHARAAGFTAAQALDDLDIVHPGPVQEFQLRLLADAGLPVR